jgi:hypothetical protein
MLIWALDIQDYDLALRLAGFVLAHDLPFPSRIKRRPACLIAEEVAEAALRAPASVNLAVLQEVEAMTESQDMPDEVRAKLYKALGNAFTASADTFDAEAESAPAGGVSALLDTGLEHYRRALSLDDGCGVKTSIQQAERRRKKSVDVVSD